MVCNRASSIVDWPLVFLMNAPLSAPPRNSKISESAPVSPVAPRAHKGKSWMLSLTGVCFIFGALVAMQLRATQQMRDNRIKEKQGAVAAATLASEMKAKAEVAARARSAMEVKVIKLTKELRDNGKLTESQVATLNGQIKELQTVSGLTPVSGPGIKIVLSDNPNVDTSDASLALPGLVHDYDLLQVVNELRSAKAEAIAVYGAGGEPVRVTGYTPIRCVGPTIMVNWDQVAAPFTIEAVGNADRMYSAVMMGGGIIDSLKSLGEAGIGVKVEKFANMELPAASGGVPQLRVAKSEATDAEKANDAANANAAQ